MLGTNQMGGQRGLGQLCRRIVLIAVICCGWIAVERLASEVLENETQRFDEAILLALRLPHDHGTPIGPRWLLRTVIDINSLGGIAILSLLTLLVMVYLLVNRRAAIAAYLVTSVLGGWALETALKYLVDRPRPTIVPQLMQETTLSFPSGHAMMATITYLTIAAILVRYHRSRMARIFLVATAILLCVMIGLCRVYLGVHYPTDVIAGWCAGASWALCCYLIGCRTLTAHELVPSDLGDRGATN
jgi:undecaprenyl-diphosphatase